MFNLTQIKGEFKCYARVMAGEKPVQGATHAVYAQHHHLFAELPDEYSYEAVLTQDEVAKLKQSGYEVIAY